MWGNPATTCPLETVTLAHGRLCRTQFAAHGGGGSKLECPEGTIGRGRRKCRRAYHTRRTHQRVEEAAIANEPLHIYKQQFCPQLA